MKIVIDVPEKVYNRFCRCCRFPDEVEEAIIAISDGTLLPKGHGRLIDADELIKQLEVMANDEWNKQVGSSKGLEEVIDIVDDISPIIEADKEERSGEE